MQATPDWVMWVAGVGLLLILSLLVFVAWWALFSDRPNGRRRCPRCWYELTYSPGMRCTECGFEARSEKDFGRTRHRWGTGVLAILGCTAIGLFVLDRVATRGWLSYVPAQALVWTLPVVDGPRSAVFVELDRRIKANELSPEQWIALTERCVAGDSGARPPSAEWSDKYGSIVLFTRARASRSDDETWQTSINELLYTIPPRIELSTRDQWPEGVGPTIDVVARDWWPAATEWRIRATPGVPDAATDVHLLRDAPIQDRSYSVVVPPLTAGRHEVDVSFAIDRRANVDTPWRRAEERTVTIPITVDGTLADTLEPVTGDEYDAVVRDVFRAGLVKYRAGSLPVRIGVNQPSSFVELFDDTAVGARVEVLRNGRLARMLDIWWAAGTTTRDRQNAWEVPWLDEELLGAPDRPDDEWVIHAYSVPELALRVKDVSRYWSGRITVPVRVGQGRRRTAPPRGWINEQDPFAADETR